MTSLRARRWVRLGFAGATGAGLGSAVFWAHYLLTIVSGNLKGPDFYSFYSGAKLFVTRGGSAVYDLALQREIQVQVTSQPPDRFSLLPYFHPPFYTLLLAPLGYLS